MNGKEKEEILVAIAKLEEKTENLENYVFRDMSKKISDLCDKMEKRFMQTLKLNVIFICSVLGLMGVLIVSL